MPHTHYLFCVIKNFTIKNFFDLFILCNKKFYNRKLLIYLCVIKNFTIKNFEQKKFLLGVL